MYDNITEIGKMFWGAFRFVSMVWEAWRQRFNQIPMNDVLRAIKYSFHCNCIDISALCGGKTEK